MAKIRMVMGYALSGVKTGRSGAFNDPRLNSRSPLLAWPELEEADETFSAPSLLDYVQWLPSRGIEGVAEARRIEDAQRWYPHTYELIHTVVHEPEAGWADTLVIVPPEELGRWIRRANLMDTAIASAKGTELDVEILHLERSPEVTEQFMDALTGAEVPNAFDLKLLLSGDRSDPHSEEIAHDLRYENANEAWARIVPWVPTSVRHLAEFAELFTGPDVWKELRPVVYTYWA